MSFVMKLGQDAVKDQKLVLLRRKYFRNILEFNQVWQQEKKETEIKVKEETNHQFVQVVRNQIEALEIEKEKLWRQKINNQDKLKYDYDHQIVERTQRFRQEKEKDKQFIKKQEIENDKVSERRLLDLIKIYDRKAVRNSSQRRLKTEMDSHSNAQMNFALGRSGNDEEETRREEPIRQLFLPLNQEAQLLQNPQTVNRQTRDKIQSRDHNTFLLKKAEVDPKISRGWHLPKISQQKGNNGNLPIAGMRSGGHGRSLRQLPMGGDT